MPPIIHGVAIQAPLDATDVAQMRRAHVGMIRVPVHWKAIERSHDTYDFGDVDASMKAVVEAGAVPLPVVFGTPGWAGDKPIGEVIATSEGQQGWERFLAVLTERYGPGGQFWAEQQLPQDGVPIWQIGNEPNLISFWGGQPQPHRYAELLQFGAQGVRSVDPTAQIAMAGMAPGSRGPSGWSYLNSLLDVAPGLGQYFDMIAPHPYSKNLAAVTHKLELFRKVLRSHQLGNKRMLITEVGWAAGGRKDLLIHRSRNGQARVLTRLYKDLARRRGRFHLLGIIWYAWRDRPREPGLCPFCATSGLVSSDGAPKPSLRAFRRSAKTPRG